MILINSYVYQEKRYFNDLLVGEGIIGEMKEKILASLDLKDDVYSVKLYRKENGTLIRKYFKNYEQINSDKIENNHTFMMLSNVLNEWITEDCKATDKEEL